MGMIRSFLSERFNQGKKFSMSELPSGYRFDPTDVELLEHYLHPRINGQDLPADFVMELDVYQYDPHQLLLNQQSQHTKQNEAYFFTVEKSENPMREDNSIRCTTSSGYWKVDKQNIPIDRADETIGFKNKLIFHDTYGNKTDWRMIEYRCNPSLIPTSSSSMESNNYIICKVRLKTCPDEECVTEEQHSSED